MIMELHLFEKIVLLAINHKKGNFIIDSLSLNYGIAGAILLELSEINKIKLHNKRIAVTDNKFTKNIILDACLKLINKSKKNRRAKFWINRIGNKSSGFKKIILLDLVHKNIIRLEMKPVFFGLFKLNRYPILNTKLTQEIKEKLRNIVFNKEKADTEGLLLLSLTNSCKLIRVLFPERREYKIVKKQIKELIENIEISEAVSQTLKEVQSAVVAATMTTYISST